MTSQLFSPELFCRRWKLFWANFWLFLSQTFFIVSFAQNKEKFGVVSRMSGPCIVRTGGWSLPVPSTILPGTCWARGHAVPGIGAHHNVSCQTTHSGVWVLRTATHMLNCIGAQPSLTSASSVSDHLCHDATLWFSSDLGNKPHCYIYRLSSII